MQDVESTADVLPESEQDRLAQILDEYMIAAERGAPISPEELLRRHPEDAEYLRGYLSGLQLFHEAALPQARPTSLVGNVPHPRQTIGDFQLLRRIGSGGMGVVYEALQISLRRRVALKVLPFSAGHDPRQIGRFRNEAQAAAQANHANIVPVYAIGEHEGVHYYAMRLIDGRSLSDVWQDRTASLQPVNGTTAPNFLRSTDFARQAPAHSDSSSKAKKTTNNESTPHKPVRAIHERVREIARLGIQAAEALHAAHEYGVVHRDVKPSNLLVDEQGKLWVTDFGLAQCRENPRLTQTGDILGTMRYMSPEQALGRSTLIDHRTDIFSLGVSLYELATAHHPAGEAAGTQMLFERMRFQCKPLRHWNRQIPIDFQTIILKSIAEFPHERYASAQEFADDLRRFLQGKPILASPPSVVSRAAKWAGRHRGFVGAAAAVFLVAFVGLFANLILSSRARIENQRALAKATDNLRQAHAVLDRFGTRLVDELAAIPGAESVRYQLLEDSLGLYRQFETTSTGDPALAADLATAYEKMGGLLEKIGDSRTAAERYTSARALWKERLAADATNIDYARSLALCDNQLALVQNQFGQTSEALATLQEAKQIQQHLLVKSPKSTELHSELATTQNNLGLVLKQDGKQVEAAVHFEDAISIQEKLLAESPDNETLLRGLAVSYNNFGSLHELTNDDFAAKSYRKSIEIERRLVKDQPRNRIYQSDLARSYNNLGFAFARRQDWTNGELCYADAIAIQENLVKASPLFASYRQDLAVSYNNLGMVQARQQRVDEASDSFQRAAQIQRLLLAAEPNDAKSLSNLGGIFNNLGMLYDGQQRFSEAESAFRQAVDFQRKAHESAPGVRLYVELLNNHYANFAQCLKRQNKSAAADEVVVEQKKLAGGGVGQARVN